MEVRSKSKTPRPQNLSRRRCRTGNRPNCAGIKPVCLRYIDASKESVAALQGVQDRIEALRNLAFTDMTNATFVQNLMVNPANGSDFTKTKPTEVVTIKAYNTATKTTSGTGIQISRPVGAIVTPSIAGSLPSASVV